MMKHILVGSVAAVAVSVAVAAADRADAGGRQLLKLTYGDFQPVFAAIKPGNPGKTAYVLDYKLTNASDKAFQPRVHFELRTETGKSFGDSYDTAAYRAAAKALGRETLPSSTGSIRGNELAGGASVDGLANFGDFDRNADDFEVRVYGLWDPVFRDRQGRTWSENRVLVLTYSRAGDEYDRQLDPIRLTSAKEILDGEPVQMHQAK